MSADDATRIHGMVSYQVDFIMIHELGHIFHSHPRLLSTINGSDDEVEQRHNIEVEADEFSHTIYKSWFYDSDEMEEELDNKFNEYYIFLESTELLFIYMAFINNANTIIREKSGDEYISNSRDTHPSAEERLLRLRNSAGLKINSEMVKYAEGFFAELMSYISSLDKEKIESGLEAVCMRKA